MGCTSIYLFKIVNKDYVTVTPCWHDSSKTAVICKINDVFAYVDVLIKVGNLVIERKYKNVKTKTSQL